MKPVILKLAREDLREICSRLADFGNDPPNKLRNSFLMFCTNVTSMPYMYPQYEQNPKYRKAVIAYDHLVFYQVENINSKDRVMVYRVLNGKRDIFYLLSSEIK
jgi:plasmid stabilization system protein ParE